MEHQISFLHHPDQKLACGTASSTWEATRSGPNKSMLSTTRVMQLEPHLECEMVVVMISEHLSLMMVMMVEMHEGYDAGDA